MVNPVVFGYLAPRLARRRIPPGIPTARSVRYYLAVARAGFAGGLAPRARRRLMQLAVTFIPAALLLDSTPTWILRHLGAAGPVGLMGPLFIVSTAILNAVPGLAVVLVVATLGRAFPTLAVRPEAIHVLGRILLVSIPPLGYCLLAEMQAGQLGQGAGPSGALFWLALVGGVVLPFGLLWCDRPDAVMLSRFAALLVVLGILAERWSVVTMLLGARLAKAGSLVYP